MSDPADFPAVSQSSAASIGGVTFQNAGAGPLGAGIATLGQTFAQGELPAGASLLASIGGTTVPVQMDVKTTYPDGSVKMAVLSIARPELAAGEAVDVAFARTTSAPAGPAIDLGAAMAHHSLTVDITPQGGATQRIDIAAELREALADGSASFWQKGPLATQARVEIPLEGSQRLVFDVTVFKDGGISVDAQFNNDVAMGAVGGRASYNIQVRLDGTLEVEETVSQGQYQNWHRGFADTDTDGGQGLGSADAGWLNIRHDVAKLSQIGAVPDYDLTLTIPESQLQKWFERTQQADWDDPLATRDVATYMPQTGARPDIGFNTIPNTSWLISQDARAAAYALGQAETASVVPWNFWDEANGRWLSTDLYPKLWTDGRSGVGRPGDPNSASLTQSYVPGEAGWVPDQAHQPNLSFVPYLLTGERWILDNLNAQASFNIISTWPLLRADGQDLVVNNNQIRASAWALRQIEDAAWANPDGSAEKAYFAASAASNWQWLVSKIPEWTDMQGEAYGWLPSKPGPSGDIAVWQQDFFASTAILAASRGNADALTYLEWASNYLIGRFQQADAGFALINGAAWSHMVYDPVSKTYYQTWEEIADRMEAGGWLVTDTFKNGGYFNAAMATLAGIHYLTGSEEALEIARQLIALNPPYMTALDTALRPNFAVNFPGLYTAGNNSGGGGGGGPSGPPPASITGTAGDDVRTLDKAFATGSADLGEGNDRLELSSAGPNTLSVRNTETIIGGTNDDVIVFSAPIADGFVDLSEGNDRLKLANGTNRLSIGDVETVSGGTGDDTLLLSRPVNGMIIELEAGADRVELAASGPNRLLLRGVETVIGSSGDDEVTYGAPITGAVADLGAGIDRLLLAGGTSRVLVSNVEFVTGSGGNDTITLGSLAEDALIELGGGADRLELASGGANRLWVGGTETIIGGDGDDAVTTTTTLPGGLVDLGAGVDSLVLAATGPHRLTVANVERITGGSGNDDITLGTAAADVLVDLGAGADRLTLGAAGSNHVLVANTETILGGGAADTVVLQTAFSSGAIIDLGGGIDLLELSSNGRNTLSVSNVETILGGILSDTVQLNAAANGVTVDLRGGGDTLGLSSAGPNTLIVRRAETVLGGAAADTVTFVGNSRATVHLGGGADTLILQGTGASTALVTGIETIRGGAGDDAVTYGIGISGGIVDLGGGNDRVVLADATTNHVTLSNVETVIGGNGHDTVVLLTLATGVSIDLGGGSNSVILASADPASVVAARLASLSDTSLPPPVGNNLTIGNIRTLTGGSCDDTVTYANAIVGGTANLGGGADKLMLSSLGPNSLTISSTETIIGGAAADTLTIGSAVFGALIDLGGGADRVTLSSAGPNSLTISNVETIVGGTQADDVMLGAAANGGSIDLGGGTDRLTLSSAGPNSLNVGGAETIIGGAQADMVQLNWTVAGIFVDLGGGADRLTLASGPSNSLTIRNTETIIGGNGLDTVTLVDPAFGVFVNLGGGADKLVLATTGSTSVTIANVETVMGGTGSDLLTLTTSLTTGLIDLGGGQDQLLLSNNANQFTISNVETMVGGTAIDRIGTTTMARLEGRGGADVLTGSAGADTLVGGRGADMLIGGAGADRFVFEATADSIGAERDLITDFTAGLDMLVFEGMLQGSFAWRGAAGFTGGGNSQARFDESTRLLHVDANGDALADMVVGLSGVSLASLSASSFLWV